MKYEFCRLNSTNYKRINLNEFTWAHNKLIRKHSGNSKMSKYLSWIAKLLHPICHKIKIYILSQTKLNLNFYSMRIKSTQLNLSKKNYLTSILLATRYSCNIKRLAVNHDILNLQIFSYYHLQCIYLFYPHCAPGWRSSSISCSIDQFQN